MGRRFVCWGAVLCVLCVAGAAMGDLVGHWKLDEGTGVILDSSGNGNDGTIVGNPTPIAGVVGKALEFHGLGAAGGGGDYINCGSGASLDITSLISIALWIRPGADDPEGQGTETAPMAKALSTANPSWSFQVRYGWGATQPYMAFTFNTSPRAWAFVGQNLEKDEWCHIACTHDGQTLKCYLDGVETDSTAMGAITSSPAPVLIGSDGWGCDWIGGIDDVRMYNHCLTPKELIEVMLGGGPELAANPVPEKEASDVPRDVVLGWSAGKFAATHDVYLGESFDDVNTAGRNNALGVLLSEGQTATTFDPPGLLDFGATYYWRIDEVNGAPDFTIYKGEVWSFTTEPFAYPVQNIVASSNASSDAESGPEKTIDGSGLDAGDGHSTRATDMWLGLPVGGEPVYIQYEFDRVLKLHEMWVWNYNVEFDLVLGFSLKDVTIEYSQDGEEWTVLDDVQFARSTARMGYAHNTTVDFQGVAARFVRLTANSNWGAIPQYGLSEIRFLHIPVSARLPQPADGATDVDVTSALSWRAGREATSHEVYLGTSAEDLPPAGSVTQANLTPGMFDFGTTYYWRVDEVGDESLWAGAVWSFVTQEYALVEGFETYTDNIDAGEAIFDTWLDGWVNNTGSTVGYLETPFAERTIVHSGRQSMPLQYDNGVSPFYSEAERTFASPQDWTMGGADSLNLYFRGAATNEAQTLYVSLEDNAGQTGTVVHDDAEAVLATEWQQWRIPLSDFAGVTASRIQTMTIGVGNRTSPTAGGKGVVYIDDIGFGRPAAP
ncbi:LamG-like jellyroll fold domain-containing protein [Anaerobaca lacustris]|uniref:Discoidin domain-containing protein n=1 Tax=Anaerobaca lacustris TaxID=3044600 RepID=A0AAW6TTZ7_9BACT|nr:discoidin domain-containing protein [Sedimentisphaerales bacterium M17dextr]